MTHEELIMLLEPLDRLIEEEVDKLINMGACVPSEEEINVIKITSDFSYGAQGVSNFSMSVEPEKRLIWREPTLIAVKSINDSDLYKATCLALVGAGVESSKADELIERYMFPAAYSLIEERATGASATNQSSLRSALLKHINDQPLTFTIKIYLRGIIVIGDPIEITIGEDSIVIRATKKEDIEREVFMSPFTCHYYPHETDCIVDVTFPGQKPMDFQDRADLVLILLRLYNVGSVRFNSWRRSSEALIGHELHSGESFEAPFYRGRERYNLNSSDNSPLKTFLSVMHPLVSSERLKIGGQAIDNVAFAYQRYCESLLLSVLPESQISNTMMGLEALLLTGDEKSEILFRLQLRAARLLGILEMDPYDVVKAIKLGYDIRSSHVHGEQMSRNTENKLKNNYGNANKLMLSLNEYLRRLIVLSLLLEKQLDKAALIKLLDSAFYDDKQRERLVDIVRQAYNRICSKPLS